MLDLREVPFGSPVYDAMLRFRHEHLRRPLGLALTPADTAGEAEQLHFAVVEGETVRAVVSLKALTAERIKLRQMCVDPDQRGTGVGAALVRFAEAAAARRGHRVIELNARETARRFYERLGYTPVGTPFTEVGLPHIVMEKNLPDGGILRDA